MVSKQNRKIKGRRDSAKFIYWDEIGETFQSGHSILIYQHFDEKNGHCSSSATVKEIQARLSPSRVYWFRTPHVVYFLGAQKKHSDYIAYRVKSVEQQWGSQIQIG